MSLAFGFREATPRKLFKDTLVCHLVALEDVSVGQKNCELWKKSCSLGLVYPTKLDTVFIPRFAHPRWCSVF